MAQNSGPTTGSSRTVKTLAWIGGIVLAPILLGAIASAMSPRLGERPILFATMDRTRVLDGIRVTLVASGGSLEPSGVVGAAADGADLLVLEGALALEVPSIRFVLPTAPGGVSQ